MTIKETCITSYAPELVDDGRKATDGHIIRIINVYSFPFTPDDEAVDGQSIFFHALNNSRNEIDKTSFQKL